MKYAVILGDGMADTPVPMLGGKTPLEFLAPENMAQVGGGALYRFRSCPEGLPPGSDVAFLSLFGNDAKQCYTGRSPLEAAGLNARLDPGDVCFRVNLVSVQNGKMASHNGHNVVGEEARGRMEALLHDEIFAGLAQGMRFAVTDTFRHVAVLPGAGEARYSLTAPHDIACEADARALVWLLAESVAQRLREARFRARTVSVGVRDAADLSSYGRQVTLPRATNVTGHIARAAWNLLVANEPLDETRPLRGLHVRASGLVPVDAPEQLELPFDARRRVLEDLDEAVDELRRRFGNTCIQRGTELLDESLLELDVKRDNVVHPVGYF